jgi:hypothetical protein
MMAPVADKEATAIPLHTEIWTDAFPQLAPVIRELTVGGRYDAYETTKLSRWSAGNVAIIGDGACHDADLGPGAGTAMMNALALAVALETAPSVPSALEEWEKRERPLTEYRTGLLGADRQRAQARAGTRRPCAQPITSPPAPSNSARWRASAANHRVAVWSSARKNLVYSLLTRPYRGRGAGWRRAPAVRADPRPLSQTEPGKPEIVRTRAAAH